MTNKIEEAFEKEFGGKLGAGLMWNVFLEVFTKGYLSGQADNKNSSGSVEGVWIALVECDDWGCKPDGYMVALTKQDLLDRKEGYENGNTDAYSLFYERPNVCQTVLLTPEAVQDILASETRCAYFKNSSHFTAVL